MKKLFLILTLIISFKAYTQNVSTNTKLHIITDAENNKKINIDIINSDTLTAYDESGNTISYKEYKSKLDDYGRNFYADDNGIIREARFFKYSEEEKKVIKEKSEKMTAFFNANIDNIVFTKNADSTTSMAFRINDLNKPCPDFDMADTNNIHYKLKDLAGSVIVLNFWFTACVPCKKEMPDLNILMKQYENKNVKFIAVTYDTKNKVSSFLKETKFDFIHVTGRKDICQLFEIQVYPTTIIIDKTGNIRCKQSGISPDIIKIYSDKIDELLK